MSLLSLWSRIPVAVKIGGAAVLALGFSGALAAWLGPHQPHVKTKTETRTKTESRQELELQHKADERQRIIDELRQRLNEKTSHQANVNTRVVERIERYAPTAGPAPTGQALQPGSLVPVAVPTPVEVVTRTTETVDTSHDQRETMADTQRKTDTTGEKHETTDAHEVQTAKSETSAKTETEKGGAGEERPSRLGIGVLTGQALQPQPFVSYDLYNKPLGPKLFGLDKIRVGLGGFLTHPLHGGSIDGGPQANLTKKRLGFMVGYEIRAKTPVAGLIYKF